MKFIAFLASTMLIVLVSQHSIMGLPLNETIVCSEGMEWINGQCVPLDSLKTSTDHESSSHANENTIIHVDQPVTIIVPAKNFGACPEGMEHGEHGICQNIQSSTTTEANLPSGRQFNIKSTTPEWDIPSSTWEADVPSTRKNNVKSTTPEWDIPSSTWEADVPSTRRTNVKSTTPEWDIPSSTTEFNVPSTRRTNVKSTTPEWDMPSSTWEADVPSTRKTNVKSTTPEWDIPSSTPEVDVQSITVVNITSARKTNVKSTTTPELDVQSTTEFGGPSTTADLDENAGGVDVVKGCPKGTQPDEEGACVAIQPSNSTKVITDPKGLLINGACPIDYKMIQGKCLYVKSKKNLTVYSTGSINNNAFSTGPRPKTGTAEQAEYELVPVLSDNSCPEGTEYSEFGLCRKRILGTTPDPLSNNKFAGQCDDGFKLINGKCTYTTQPPRSKSIGRMTSTSTIANEEPSFSGSTSTVGEDIAYDHHSEVTSSPLETQ